jgi:hypothetical protein
MLADDLHAATVNLGHRIAVQVYGRGKKGIRNNQRAQQCSVAKNAIVATCLCNTSRDRIAPAHWGVAASNAMFEGVRQHTWRVERLFMACAAKCLARPMTRIPT